jgi:hypothetical protein
VSAQSGKSGLSTTEASALIASAQQIIATIG